MSQYKVIPNLPSDLLEFELNKAAEDGYEIDCVKQDGTIIMVLNALNAQVALGAFGFNFGADDTDVETIVVETESATVTPKLNPDDYAI